MTTRQSSPNARLSALLSRFPPETVALAKRCLSKLRRTFPGSYEIVYEYSKSLVVAFGASDRGYEAIVALAAYSREVRLYFGAGKSLPDPEGLLQGSAGVRWVPLEKAADLDRTDIQALIKAAIKRSGASFSRTGSTRIRIVIKSESKKRPTRRTARA